MWWNTRFSTIAVMLPSVMPLPRMICAHSGTAFATSGSAVTYIARPRLVATMTTLRWSWKSTRDRVWMPTTATVANMAMRGAAEHRVRDARHDRAGLRDQPEDDHDDARRRRPRSGS